MELHSSAFANNERLDKEFTGDGEDLSPPLNWTGVPPGTRSLALICDDPDAPSPKRPAKEPWVHWVIYNIPPQVTELPAGIEPQPEPAEVAGARQGVNSWTSDNLGYRGPAPPPGSGPHRYVFHLYALDRKLDLAPGATKQELLKAMAGHTVEESQWIGVYER